MTLWDLETRLWTDRDAWDGLHPEAVMVFPGDGGLMDADAIRAALAEAPRWREADLTERREIRQGDIRILAYRAVARREGEAPYRANCSSVWIEDARGRRILHHQQSF
jgi:hypothetical protein